MDSNAGFSTQLIAAKLHPKGPARVRQLRVPHLGRFMYTRDPGDARRTAAEYLQTNLHAAHFDGDGRLQGEDNLGSGNVQENFVMGLMQDQVGTTSNKAAPVMAGAFNYMYTGTGVSANTYDYQLGTGATASSGAITPTLTYSADNSVITCVATVSYLQTLAITEWGIFNINKQGIQQNCNGANTWNAQGQASSTWSATLGAAANLQAGSVVVIGGSVGMFCISNSLGTAGTTIGSVTPTTAFYNLSSGGGAGTQPYTNYNPVGIYPLMSDHKTFSAINVVNGDSIQFTWVLTVTSGG